MTDRICCGVFSPSHVGLTAATSRVTKMWPVAPTTHAEAVAQATDQANSEAAMTVVSHWGFAFVGDRNMTAFVSVAPAATQVAFDGHTACDIP